MAQQTTVVLTDDIDGTKGLETVAFALDGAHYEIDLNTKNAKNLRKAMAEFVENGPPINPGGSASSRTKPGTAARKAMPDKGTDKSELSAIRAWAKDNGYEVSERGRISAEVRAAYNDAK